MTVAHIVTVEFSQYTDNSDLLNNTFRLQTFTDGGVMYIICVILKIINNWILYIQYMFVNISRVLYMSLFSYSC